MNVYGEVGGPVIKIVRLVDQLATDGQNVVAAQDKQRADPGEVAAKQNGPEHDRRDGRRHRVVTNDVVARQRRTQRPARDCPAQLAAACRTPSIQRAEEADRHRHENRKDDEQKRQRRPDNVLRSNRVRRNPIVRNN